MKQNRDAEKSFVQRINATDLNRFQKSILAVLSRIKIENFDEEFKNDVKVIYELLSHLKRPQNKNGKVNVPDNNIISDSKHVH